MHAERVFRILKRVLGVSLGAFACATLGFLLYLNVLGPEARAAREFLKRMPVDTIQSIVLEPIPRDPKTLSTRATVITRRDQIRALATLIHTALPWRPNHPHRHWAMVLRFELQGRSFSGQVLSTSNQGVLFYYGLGTEGGPVYGTYRQDELGSILEAITDERTP
jgi:hypothetical protein